MNTISSSENFIWMTGIRLDRLLKQRCALPDFSFDPSPPRGGLGSLSVEAGCLATEFRTFSGLLF
jgi:hypothetical protein